MVFDPASVSRDLLLSAACLFGAAMACAVPARRAPRSKRFAPRRGLAAALFAAGAIGVCAVAFIAIGGDATRISSFLYTSLALFVLSFLSVLFPRVVGFPLSIAVCSGTILFAWSFLAYPPAAEGAVLARFRSAPDGRLLVWMDGSSAAPLSVDASAAPLFRIVRVGFDERVPLVGGTSRAALRGLQAGDSLPLSPPRRSLVDLIGGSGGAALFAVPGVDYELIEVSPDPDWSAGARMDLRWIGGEPRFSR